MWCLLDAAAFSIKYINKPLLIFSMVKYRLKDAVKENDELMGYVLRFISRRITWVLLKTPVKPNHITMFSIVPAIFASYFFIMGGYQNIVIGASLAFLYLILDLVDGEIARVKNISTIRGRWADGIIGFVTYPLFIFSIAFGLKTYVAMILGSLAIIAAPLQYLVIHFYKSEIVKSDERIKLPLPSKLNFLRFAYGTVLFYTLLLVFCLLNKPLLLLLFYATIGNLFWMGIVLMQYRNIKDM